MSRTIPVTLAAPGAVTAGGTTPGFYVGMHDEAMLVLNVSAVAGTPTLTVFIDSALDGNSSTDGTLWYQIASFPAQTAVTPNPSTAASGASVLVVSLGKVVNATSFGDRIRVRWTLTGGTPSATFTVVGKFKDGQ